MDVRVDYPLRMYNMIIVLIPSLPYYLKIYQEMFEILKKTMPCVCMTVIRSNVDGEVLSILHDGFLLLVMLSKRAIIV